MDGDSYNHLLLTLYNGALPSFFEIHLLEQMDGMLKLGMHRISASITSDDPNNADGNINTIVSRVVSYINSHFEYVYASSLLLANYLSVTYYDASLMEYLYGLKRVSYDSSRNQLNKQSNCLSRSQRTLSVASIVFIPYLLDALRKLRRTSDSRTLSTGSSIVAIGSCFARACLGAYGLSTAVQKLLYVLGYTQQWHPLFTLLNISLIRRSATPSVTIDRPPQVQSLLKHSATLKVGLFLSMLVAYRAIGWWLNNDSVSAGIRNDRRRQRNSLTANLLARPEGPRPSRFTAATENPLLCPICKKQRVHPCATSSGYIFCYLCIDRHIQLDPHCPVTGLPVTKQELLRIYDHNETGMYR